MFSISAACSSEILLLPDYLPNFHFFNLHYFPSTFPILLSFMLFFWFSNFSSEATASSRTPLSPQGFEVRHLWYVLERWHATIEGEREVWGVGPRGAHKPLWDSKSARSLINMHNGGQHSLLS